MTERFSHIYFAEGGEVPCAGGKWRGAGIPCLLQRRQALRWGWHCLRTSCSSQEARKDGTQVLVARMNKNKKFQKEQLNKEGYEEFVEFYKEELKR